MNYLQIMIRSFAMWINCELSVGLLTSIKSTDDNTCLLQIIPQGTADTFGCRRLVSGIPFSVFIVINTNIFILSA